MQKPIAKIAVSAAKYWIDKPYSYMIPNDLIDKIKPGIRVMVPFSRGNSLTEGIVLTLCSEEESRKLKCISSILDSFPVLDESLIRLSLWMRERYFCTVYDAVKAMLPTGLWYNFSSICSITDGWNKEKAYDAAGRSKKQCRLLDVVFSNGRECDYRDIEIAFGEENPLPALKALYQKGVLNYDKRENRKVKDKTATFVTLNVSSEEALETANAKKRSAPSQASALELLSTFGGASMNDIRYLTGVSVATVKRLKSLGFVTFEEIEVFRRPDYKTGVLKSLPQLNDKQTECFNGIQQLVESKKPGAALLYGVTGSGKTSVYIKLIDKLLKEDKSSIMLVPEISLTPQMLMEFSSYFGENIAVLHSLLSVGERYDEWKRIKNGSAKVVIGTRSAIFAPVNNLGLIIIDEEQEDTYKSENNPRYNACEVAKFRCAQFGATLLLGSATPNIVSRYSAQIGKYSFFSLPDRYNERALPEVQIVDMKRELRNGNMSDFSSVLIAELDRNLKNGEQSILFLNRRGKNKLITCADCGYTYRCPRCSVSLTYHSANSRLMCHHCGYSQAVDKHCPDCGGKLKYIGAGTQKIIEEISELLPEARTIRMDADTVSGSGSHSAILDKFRDEKIPILVGTQMVTKGLNFPNVTLVGVISADQSLYTSDYRASEKTFSLITQVVGRSGRGEKTGRAIIQTFTPKNQVILQASRQDYDSFYNSEIELRRLQWVPPFADIFTLTATGIFEAQVIKCLQSAKNILSLKTKHRGDLRILGPAPLPIVRINNRFRYRLTIACREDREIRELISQIICYCSTNKEFKGVSVFGDINPNI